MKWGKLPDLKRGKLPDYPIAIVCSLSIHALLLAIVIIGWTPEHKDAQIRPRYIQATLLQIEPPKAPVTKKQVKKKPPDNSKQKLAEKKRAEKKRLERLRREKKQSEERARKERLQKEQEKEKTRKQKEAEAKRAAEEARRREQELAFADALDDEEQYITAAADEQLVGSYSAYIRDRIVNNWSRPPSARRNMKAELSIQLVPTGRVISVAIEKSSGNDAFDRSAEQAVYKVERFEKLQDLSQAHPRLFEKTFRHFRLVFTPDDLRL